MSIFYANLNYKDIEVLNLYLSGMIDKDIAAIAFPDGWAGNSSKNAYDKCMQRLRITLRLPIHKKLALANKDKILKNLEIHLSHVKRLKEFNEAEEARIYQDGFIDMRDT